MESTGGAGAVSGGEARRRHDDAAPTSDAAQNDDNNNNNSENRSRRRRRRRRRWVDRLAGVAAGACLSLAVPRLLNHGGADEVRTTAATTEQQRGGSGGQRGRSSSPLAFPSAYADDGGGIAIKTEVEACVGPDGSSRPCDATQREQREEAFSMTAGSERPGCTIGNRHLHEIGSYNFSWLHAKKNFYADVPPPPDPSGATSNSGRATRRQHRLRPTCKRISPNGLTPDKMYQRHFMRSQPVVLAGAWSAHLSSEAFLQNWTLKEIARRWGDHHEIDGMWNDDNVFQRVERVAGHGFRYVQPHYSSMLFKDFVEEFEKQERGLRRRGEALARLKTAQSPDEEAPGPPPPPPPNEYVNLQQLALYEILKGWTNVTEPFSLPPLPPVHTLMEKDLNSIRLWIAGRGKVSKLHVDNYDNILASISGVKTVYLVEPIHLHRMYPSEVPFYINERLQPGVYRKKRIKMRIRHFSPVDALKPDLDRFPLFGHLVENNLVMECRLEPGDLLLLPALWWHEVHNEVPEGSYYRGGKRKKTKKKDMEGKNAEEGGGGESENKLDKLDEDEENDEEDEDEEAEEVGANIAVNYWYRPHSLLTRYHSMTMDNIALDWVNRGRECDAHFEKEAQRNRLRKHAIETGEGGGEV